MLYFKNTQLAEEQHVTLRTVLNWVQAAKDGRLDLDLYAVGEKSYVANTARNVATITRLVSERRKYRNQKSSRTIEPNPEFYTLYSDAQIHDIITNLEIHREIPRQYNYFDGGAAHWDAYVRRMEAEETPNNLNMTRKLLTINEAYIDDLLTNFEQINIVDVGVGNAFPVKGLIAHFLNSQKLGRYIAIDISPAMLDIARKNISEWFGEKIHFEAYELDASRERFASILAKDFGKSAHKRTANVILLLGGTLQNFRKRDVPLQVINDSMGMSDLVIHTQKLDSQTTRRYFDFNHEPGNVTLSPNHRLMFDLFNLDPNCYDVEMGYNETESERYIRIRLKVALNIRFKFNSGERVLAFDKGETILLWRASQENAKDVIDQLDKNDFYLLHMSQSADQDYILTISRVKRD